MGYALLARETDEELIRARLHQMTTALRVESGDSVLVRGARIRRAFSETLTKDVVVRVPDFPQLGQGRDALTGIAVQSGRRYRTAEIDLSHTSVSLDAKKSAANVKSEATLTATDSGGLHRDTRHVLFRFNRTKDGWRISSIEVSPPPDLPPEARP